MYPIFIYNTQSGKGISKSRLNKIISYIKSLFPSVILCPTYKKGDAKIYTIKHLKKVNIIFVLGGDGTIHDIISAIIPTTFSPKICIIPNGTMNDLSHSLNLPKDYKKAIDLSLTNNYRYYNAIKINNHYAIYATAIGRFSSTSYKTKQSCKNLLGKLSYFLYAVKDLFSHTPINAKITIDGKKFDGCYALILTCIHKYIAGFNIGKNIDLKSGKCILVEEIKTKRNGSLNSSINIAKFFIKGIGKSTDNPNIKILDFKNITIILEKPIPIVLDGEKQISNTYNISIIKNAVKIFTNKNCT